jgi:transposase
LCWKSAVAAALAHAGLPVAVVNPRQVRQFALATGQLAKIDRLDARALRGTLFRVTRSLGAPQ